MSYTPPPIKRRNVRVDSAGNFHYEEGATGCLRKLAFWTIAPALVALAGFIALGTTHFAPIPGFQFLTTMQHDSAQIRTHFMTAVHQLFGAL